MKYAYMTALLFSCLLTHLSAQSNLKAGVAYFGHTLTHPGGVLELELEREFSERASLPFRIDLGYYRHARNHDGLFLDAHIGLRQYARSGFFWEESIGIGILQTMLNGEDGVFEVGEDGTVRRGSVFNQPDLMPSVTLGLGWDLTHRQDRKTLLWLRPKLYWQYPQKLVSVYHVAVQAGFSWQLR
ncbi:hypothetical protein [Flavilitoribacter nigricans]|uniref:Outer membrane protein beta-barrel domain-containing protein n=1 Tax=Flavilitoribacter nigricans (strain ATCC 23147 / DSM 23189 / NBRC 102662 / NCIMB 1420 / SS-2) TaxID=1122177 RepID=A0A2D0NHF4_FLAN2|nr:hypothetical protein [Flavilitoribacter nigricans]PHN07907.1 hypothetical protein CRP01_03905 [Flavilitoribacter nigricans DSM 23189 = NBRC 102662]